MRLGDNQVVHLEEDHQNADVGTDKPETVPLGILAEELVEKETPEIVGLDALDGPDGREPAGSHKANAAVVVEHEATIVAGAEEKVRV